MRPDITCTRCGTVVPWGPYCPHCVAYLEFAGDPPWAPDAPVEEPPVLPDVAEPIAAEAAEPTVAEAPFVSEPDLLPIAASIDIESAVAASDHPVESAVVPSAPELEQDAEPARLLPEIAPGFMVDTTPPPVPPSAQQPARIPWYRPTRSQRRGYVAAAALSGLIVLCIALLAGWSTLFVTVPVIMGWALVSGLLFFVEHHEEEEHEEVPDEEPLVPAEEPPVPDGGLEARAPQQVEGVAVRARTATITRATMGDTPCPSCGKPNGATRSYCDWCGAVMAGATLAPSTQPHTPAPTDDEKAGNAKRRRGRGRSPSRSWRNPLLSGGVVLIVLGVVLIAFFGPGALQLRGGMTRVYQQISQWIDPFTGTEQPIVKVTASSTLPGTSPDLIAGSDVRTFWASNALPGFGIGTTLTYELTDGSEINRMIIFPGIQGPQFDTRALATPREITLTFDDGTSKTVELESVEEQTTMRQLVEFDPVATQKVILTINTVYPPRDASEGDIGEVAISGTEFLKVPAAPPVIGVQQGMREPKLPGMPGSVGG